ncbi:hypothetical protein [Microbacterium sp. PMB16]|uniref:hypothetical protein n=1 Tax=Microbacterium sp. PMB16 TaxID=3120157 RepID=UPI003F4C23E5
MTTFGLANDLAEVMLPIGMIGAALAAVCAVVAGIAVMRGAGGLTGGAVGLWIVFALLSLTASFANQWLPLIASGAVLAAMLVLGGVVRAIVSATEHAREPRRRKADVPAAARQKATAASVSVSTSAIAVVR